MKRLLLLIALSFLVAGSSAKETLKLCGVEWPPFTYVENNSIVAGLSHDIIKEAFGRLDVSVVIDSIPWPRCEFYVKHGKYDAILDNSLIGDWLIKGQYPATKYTLAVYVRDDFDQTKFSWESLAGKTVGFVRGYDYTERIKNYRGWDKELSSTDEQLLVKLKVKRYDYVVLDTYGAPLLAEKLNIKIRKLEPEIDSTNLYLSFNNQHTEILKAYDEIISQMIDDGSMDKLYLKYLPHNYSDILKK